MKHNKDIRIAVIGGGPGGLGACEALRDKGYQNITLFESLSRVGGKSLSLTYKTPSGDEIIYECGSFVPLSSKNLHRLIKKNDLHLGKQIFGKNNPNVRIFIKVFSLTKKKPLLDFTKYTLGYPLSLKNFYHTCIDTIKLLRCLFKYRKIKKPGFTGLNIEQLTDLSIPYEQWIDKQNFKILDMGLKIAGVAASMGNPQLKNEVQALLWLKGFLQIIKWPPSRMQIVNGSFKYIKEGYQELWTRVAKQHKVLLNTNIQTIIRKEDHIEIHTTDNKFIFDKLIVTCSLTQASNFLEMTEIEKNIFTKVKYGNAWRVIFLAKNLPHDASYFLYEPYMENYDCPLSAFQVEGEVGNGVWLFTGAISSSFSDPDLIKPLLKKTEKVLNEIFNAEILEWINVIYWPEETPHFDKEQVRDGVYQKLDILQGENNTYYLGQTLSGMTHATVVEYSYAMINKFF